MKGYVLNIEKETLENENYRKILYTAKNSQLVVMSIESGEGKVIINENEYPVTGDWAVVIPAGCTHNVINIGSEPLKLYSIYSPAEHKDGTVHATKAEEKEEHFDGVTTE